MALFNIGYMLKRIEDARNNKALWESLLRDCYDYAMPEKQTMDNKTKGTMKRNFLYDDTAVEALDRFAARTQSQVVPAWRKWCMFKAGSEIPDENKEELEGYLSEATEVLFDHINHSNFTTQATEAFLEMGISTGCLIIEEGDGIKSHLNFRSVPISELIVEATSQGRIGTAWRDITVPARDIKQIWSKAKLSDNLEKILAKDDDTPIHIIEGVAFDEKTRKYISMVLYPQDKYVLFEEELETSAYVIFRESVTSGETLGRGRVMKKLPTIKLLNKVVEFYLRAAAMSISGMYTAMDDGIINPDMIVLEPGVIIPVGSNDNSNPSLKRVDTAGDPQLANLIIKDLQYSIKNFMLSEPFGQIDETPVRSATEMSIRDNESREMAGASFGRLQSEFLEPVITRSVDILKKSGKIADIRIDGKEVTVKFTSPAAKKQDMAEVDTLVQYAQVMQFLPPEYVEEGIKLEDMPQSVAELMGIPQKYMRTKVEKEKRAKAKQMQQQQMMQQQVAMQGATAQVETEGKIQGGMNG